MVAPLVVAYLEGNVHSVAFGALDRTLQNFQVTRRAMRVTTRHIYDGLNVIAEYDW